MRVLYDEKNNYEVHLFSGYLDKVCFCSWPTGVATVRLGISRDGWEPVGQPVPPDDLLQWLANNSVYLWTLWTELNWDAGSRE
jgi:hypothetical protein